MLAYCQIKAGHHRQSVKSILLSSRIFPSRYNAASGYLKIVLQNPNPASSDSESNSYWMGSGTTHFSAVIKVRPCIDHGKICL
jgi:hypothetical protein